MCDFSSSGKTRDEKLKPEISAPGKNVQTPLILTGDKIGGDSGTSFAAPAVASIIAVMLGITHSRGIPLSIDEIRQRIIEGANQDIFENKDITTEEGVWNEMEC